MAVERSVGWQGLTRSPAVALAALVVFLAGEHVALGKYSVLLTGDNAEIFQPWFISAALEPAGTLLDRFSAAGSDGLTQGAHTPVNLWLFRLLPGWLAGQLLVLAAIAPAVLGSYALGRRALKLEHAPAMVAALLFTAFQGANQIVNVLCWLPALIALTGWALDRPSSAPRWLAAIAAVLFVGDIAYLSRLFPFPSLVLLSWFVVVERRRPWALLAAAGMSALLLVPRLGEIAAFVDMAQLSHASLVRSQPRVADIVREMLFEGSPLWDNWSHRAASIVTLLGLWTGAWRNRAIVGLVLMVAAGILLPIAATAVQVMILDRLPQLYGYQLRRFMVLTTVALPFLGALALQRLMAERPRRLRHAAIAVVALAAIADDLTLKYAALREWFSQGNYVANFESPVLRDLAGRMAAANEPLRAEMFQVYTTFLHAYGIETLGGYQPLFLRRTYDYWAKMSEPRAAALPLDHVDRKGAVSPPYFRGDRVFLTADDHLPQRTLGESYRLNMLSLANVAYVVSRDRLLDSSLVEERAAPAAWSGLSEREKITVNFTANLAGRSHLFLYRNTRVLPRFFAVGEVRVEKDGDAVLRAVAAADAEALRSMAVLEAAAADGIAHGQRFAALRVTLERYGADAIDVGTEGDGEGFLVASNAFSPYWRVTIDGQPARLLPADHAFWGVVVPPGSHRVAFRYVPPYSQRK
jgi:hypothetical protein